MQLEVDRILETDKEEQTGRKPGGWQKHLKQFWWAYIVLLIVGVALIAPLVWLRAFNSSTWPSSTRTVMTAAASK